ncbi:MAG: MBL fold metallo-hydrolase [Actinobacteria bacterium]|nr:MAG: MBL fold metallo-hydrolase [Actinomycetota bacterium]
MGSTSIEWFGCATFRVKVRGRTLWFDTFLERGPGAAPVGITPSEVDQADMIFVSHAHFDHLLGADTIATGTGATVVGNYETARMLRGNGVPREQILPVSGGETVDCGDDVRVRVFPSVHTHLWASANFDSGAPCIGDLGVAYQERRAKQQALFEMLYAATPDIAAYAKAVDPRTSRDDGGQLIYLLESPDGSILFSQSTGYWSGILRALDPDVAVLAVTGRPNLDGEPFQGSLAEFVVSEVEILKPETVVFCHHDAWMPPLPPVNVEPAAQLLGERATNATLLDLSYATPVSILG